jgi:hypothetical protein
MHFQTQSVAQGVPEGVAESAGDDDLPGKGITLSGRHPGSEMFNGPPLSALHQLMQHSLAFIGRSSHHHGPGQVGAVPVHLSAEVDQQQLALTHAPAAAAGVRQRRSGTGGHNSRERVPLTAVFPQRGLEASSNLQLGLPHANTGQHLAQRILGHLCGGSDGRDFFRRFDCSLAFHQLDGWYESRAGDSAHPLGITHGQGVTLDSDAAQGR